MSGQMAYFGLFSRIGQQSWSQVTEQLGALGEAHLNDGFCFPFNYI